MERNRFTTHTHAFWRRLVWSLPLILAPACSPASGQTQALGAGAPQASDIGQVVRDLPNGESPRSSFGDSIQSPEQERGTSSGDSKPPTVEHPDESQRFVASLTRGPLPVAAALEIRRIGAAAVDSPLEEGGPERNALTFVAPEPALASNGSALRASSLPDWSAVIPIALLAAGSLVRLAGLRVWNRPLLRTPHWFPGARGSPAQGQGQARRHQPGPTLDEGLLDQLAAAALDGVLVLDEAGSVMHANALAAAILGADDSKALIGINLHDWVNRSAPLEDRVSGNGRTTMSVGGQHAGGIWHLDATRRNGDGITAEVSISAVRVGARWGAIAILRDVTERVRTQRAVTETRESFRRIVEDSLTGILILDPRGTALYANTTARGLFPARPGKSLGAPIGSPEQAAARREVSILRADGSRGVAALSVTKTSWLDQPAFLATLEDITERKTDEERMCRLAFEDTLTSLPNRSRFLDHLRLITRRSRDQADAFALLFMDLDRFKIINDTLGHAVGDDLLAAVASRLANLVRGADYVARMGGDEFTAIVRGVRTAEDVEAVVRKFRDAFRDPFAFQDRTLYMTASIGVALYPKDGNDPDLLLRHADTAMYHAKSRGAGLFSLYQPAMSLETQFRLDLEGDLHNALARGELVLHYQPQVRLADRAVIGAEALLRWQHPKRGLLAPDLFVPLLEETGLIIEVGQWVLESACTQAVRWQQRSEHAPPVSINVSPIQVERGDLAESIQRLIRDRGLRRGLLHLELTETAMFRNMERSVQLLNRLVALGVHLAIDDFGTGHGSLGMIRRLPVSAVKLDREFVGGVAVHPADLALAKATIAMAHGLGKTVTAEGVETAEQVQVLLELGCDAAQGRYFGCPVPPEEFKLSIPDRGVHGETNALKRPKTGTRPTGPRALT